MASKQLERLVATDPRFDCYTDERDTGDGFWLYTAPGYWNPQLETHCIHESAVREVLALVGGIEPCRCEGCCDALNAAAEEREEG